jgi:homogentisate 1,2-dioxygenase
MPQYHALGSFPKKRHVVFRQPDGRLYAEELVSTEGFSNVYSLLYHVYPPTLVKSVGEPYDVSPSIAIAKNLKHHSFQGFMMSAERDYIKSRRIMFTNADLQIGLAAPSASMDYFYKNGDSDEMIFIHTGSGTLHTAYGKIKFGYGDYLIIPRGVIYKLEFDSAENRHFIIESHSPIAPPSRYRNEYGQLLEHSPYCERDIRKPEDLETHDEKGEFQILIKKQWMIFPYVYETHPFDVVGWDGNFYPWAFSIHEFEPITGRVHQPPPVHQTFEGHNFVVCSFVPRLYDYHPQAIPAPYHHSNIDSDEILYYVDGDFMSRKNVQKGQITLHPGGIPHGPHPGTVEKSIGARSTEELAVMVDPFRPLMITKEALGIEMLDYHMSWLG